jgi:hypothetical protein
VASSEHTTAGRRGSRSLQRALSQADSRADLPYRTVSGLESIVLVTIYSMDDRQSDKRHGQSTQHLDFMSSVPS